MLWRHNWQVGKKTLFEFSYNIYHSKGLSSITDHFLLKGYNLKSRRKEIFEIFLSSVIRKNLKQAATEIHFFKHAQIINY